jgi:glycosyltransferase involved in cell wall biosynthesis
MKSLRKHKNNQIQHVSMGNSDCELDLHKSSEYVLLRKYYLNILNDIDFIHYNSAVSKDVYDKYLSNKNGGIINITHNDIKDKRKPKKFNRDYVNFGYVGSIDYNKGFFTLYDALKALDKNNLNKWRLNVYGNKNNGPEDKNIIYNGTFEYKDLDRIYNDIDALIVPSMWKETFGFIALEALSHGVPCIISDNVGSKDIIEDEKLGIVFNPENLRSTLEDLVNNRNILCELNKNILKNEFQYTMSNHVKSIEKMYNNLL